MFRFFEMMGLRTFVLISAFQLSFPPTIYYKVYLHNAVVDLNSFSPRDYTTTEYVQKMTADQLGVMYSNGSLPSGNNNSLSLTKSDFSVSCHALYLNTR
jgi:hypothetical protein